MEERTAHRQVTGFMLKWIAVVTMVLDHISAVFLWDWLLEAAHGTTVPGWRGEALGWAGAHLTLLWQVQWLLRLIGRLAFPIFCFLLVEGFCHTRNVKHYALRLGVFALLSEIPFDLAFSHGLLALEKNNVFFTLLIGLGALYLLDALEKRDSTLVGLLAVCGAALAAELLHTDYGAAGVMCIVVLYFLRQQPLTGYALAVVVLTVGTGVWTELAALAMLPVLAGYHGARGRQQKYFFYAFYPIHLLVLAALRWWMLVR